MGPLGGGEVVNHHQLAPLVHGHLREAHVEAGGVGAQEQGRPPVAALVVAKAQHNRPLAAVSPMVRLARNTAASPTLWSQASAALWGCGLRSSGTTLVSSQEVLSTPLRA